ISRSMDSLQGVAAHRKIEPARLGRLIRGELDWIVMKAMEKDRARRYETANALGMDLQRYLSGEAVVAAPASATYKLGKLARRYRAPRRAAAVFALLLVEATVFSSWQAVRATRAQAAALAEKQRADQQAATATRITEYLQQMLGAANPDSTKGPDCTVRQL